MVGYGKRQEYLKNKVYKVVWKYLLALYIVDWDI